jgi:sugar-specific transcriptional regulator TrmB
MFEHFLLDESHIFVDEGLTEERLEKRLLEFGFERDEAKIYLFLLKIGPCPAGIIARRFDTNRMKAYRTLKALEEKGLVQSIIGRPVKFVAVPVETTLNRYIDEFRGKLSELEKSEKDILREWEAFSRRIIPPSEEPRFRIFQGRRQIYDLLIQMCARAEREICIVTTGNDLTRLSLLNIDDNLKGLVRDGIQVCLLTQVNDQNFDDVENFLDPIQVRHIALPAPMRFVVIDEKETITTVAMDDSISMTTQDDTGIWTNAPSYVMAMKVFFDALWGLSPEAGTIMESIKTGRLPQEIRLVTTHENYVEIFLKMIQGSKKSVDLLVKRLGDLPIPVLNLREMLEKNIRMRLLTQLEYEDLNDVNVISETASVMHRSGTTDLLVLIADESEVLLFLPGLGAKGQAIWSNLKAYVETLIQVFEEYWKTASPVQEIVPKLRAQTLHLETLKLVQQALEQSGFIIEIPGTLTGTSGAVHSFDLVARSSDAPDKPFAVGLLVEGKAFSSLIELIVRSAELKPATLILASKNPLGRADADLAELYGIKIIYADEPELLAKKVGDEAMKIFRG